MDKKCYLGILTVLLLSANSAVAGLREGSYSISPMAGAYIVDGGENFKTTAVLGLRGGYNFTQKLAVEALFDYVPTVDAKNANVSSSTMSRFGGQVLYHFCDAACNTTSFVPYVAAGVSGLKYSGKAFDTQTVAALDYGLGAKYFTADNHALRADVRVLTYKADGRKYDVEALLGYTYQFGGIDGSCKPAKVAVPEPIKVVPAPMSAPAPKPAPVAAVPAPEPVVAPAKVVAAPVAAPVVEPVKTVAMPAPLPLPVPIPAVPVVAVLVDTDNDGVPDTIDKCPDTPAGVKVDENGCPVDSDKDGVPDYLDKCPNTVPGTKVNSGGCEIEAAKKFCNKPAIIEIAFDTKKSDIKAMYHNELDKLGAFLTEFPSANGTIEGHSDADGSKEANIKLSQARADHVRDYIVSKFKINAARISAIGYGPAKPIASNKTAAGKAKNRRIEAKFSCE